APVDGCAVLCAAVLGCAELGGAVAGGTVLGGAVVGGTVLGARVVVGVVVGRVAERCDARASAATVVCPEPIETVIRIAAAASATAATAAAATATVTVRRRPRATVSRPDGPGRSPGRLHGQRRAWRCPGACRPRSCPCPERARP